MKILDSINGVATNQLPYLPEFIMVDASVVTGVKITALGKTNSINLTLAQSLQDATIRPKFGSDGNFRIIRIADGLLPQSNTTVEVVAGGASAVYAFSTRKGSTPLYCFDQTVNANSEVILEDFEAVGLSNANAADQFVITTHDGVTQNLTKQEVESIAQAMSNENANGAVVSAAWCKRLQYIPTVQTTITVVTYKA